MGGQWQRHLSSLMPVNAVQALIGFGSLAVYSRLMSPESYGGYVLALTSQMLGQWALYSWLVMSVARFTPRAREESSLSELLSTAYLLAGIISLSCLAMAALYHFAGGAKAANGPLITATLVYGAVRGFTQLGLEFHRNRLDIRRYSLLESTQALIGLALGAWLVSRPEGGPEGAFIGMALANLMISLWDAPRLLSRVSFRRYSRRRAGEFCRYGMPMSLSLILNLGMANLDRFLLAALNGQAAVAIYGAASALGERPLSIVFVWVGTASTSLGFNAMERSAPEQARQTMESAARTLIMLTWPMATGLAVLAEPLTDLMLGSGFRAEVAALLPLIALVGILKGFAEHYFAHFFQLTQRTGLLSITLIVALAVSLVSNWILLPRLGTIGAPVSALMAYSVAILLQGGYACLRFRVGFPWQDLLKVALSCGLMFALVEALSPLPTMAHLTVGVAVGVLSYTTFAWALNIANVRTVLLERFRPGHGPG